MPGPARITIELEPPPTARGRWRTRTRVVDAIPPIEPVEPREPAVTPVAYEPPAECTCLDGADGWCDLDHANA
jgi:hypothetical protein